MTENVAYAHEIACPSCGLHYAGYLEIEPGGKGMATCPRCGATIAQALPEHYITQLAPADYESPAHPREHLSHYPGLYSQSKHAPRFDLRDLVRVLYSPAKAFKSLYLTTNLQRSLALVVVFSIISVLASVFVTVDAATVLHYDTRDALEISVRGVVSWLISLFSFLVFCLVSAVISKGVFGGRGHRSMTITLLGYCFPAYVVLSVLLLAIFSSSFIGTDLLDFQTWGDQTATLGAVLFLILIFGAIWLVWVVARAISVANDVSIGEGVLTAIMAAIPAGAAFLIVGAVMRLPVGLIL